MEQATEKQVNYIRILTDEARNTITAEWARNAFLAPQRKGLKAKLGSDRFWDLTREDHAREWQLTVDGALVYLTDIDNQATTMSKAEASKMIDALKTKNIVYLYWQNAGR